MSMSPGFVAYVKSMVQGWLDEAKASKKERDATTPKSRAVTSLRGSAGGGRRAVDGDKGRMIWSPPGSVAGGTTPLRRQVMIFF